MLTESFIAATLTPPEKQVNAANLGIRVHELQPLPALKSTFKKSSSNPNCVALNKTHIFAAQADKAVVHVYSRERNNQEVTVPFPEKIRSLALAGEKDDAGILVLGTEGGRLIVWELGTGRQVFTPQHHLQPVTCLATDVTATFLFSGSSDSNIHVWSLIDLLSFSTPSRGFDGPTVPLSPLRSLSAHRTTIKAIASGHSASSYDFAVSASKDGTCIVWDYRTGTALHTYLLPENPLCIVLDPADRAFYSGYEDGSIRLIDFYENQTATNPLHDPALQATPSQPAEKDKWILPEGDASAILCLGLSYDGTLLLSGHENGKVYIWDIATGRFQKVLMDVSAPITNLIMLPPEGFLNQPPSRIKLHKVVKPQYETFANGSSSSGISTIPSSYTYSAQFTSSIPIPGVHDQLSFQQALANPLFSNSLLDRALAEFGSSRESDGRGANSAASEDLRVENAALTAKLESALAAQRRADASCKASQRAEWARRRDEDFKAGKKRRRRLLRIRAEETMRKREMGEEVEVGDEEMEDEEDGDLSSSTDED